VVVEEEEREADGRGPRQKCLMDGWREGERERERERDRVRSTQHDSWARRRVFKARWMLGQPGQMAEGNDGTTTSIRKQQQQRQEQQRN
jgi:hypothetical protein